MRRIVTLPTLTPRHWCATTLLALLLLGMTFAPVTMAQSEDRPHLMVITKALNVRSGPGITFPILGLLTQGDEVPVIGHHAASGWWQVQLSNDTIGWVSGGSTYVSVSGDTGSVPQVIVPISPPDSATTLSSTGSGPMGTIVFQVVSGGPIYAIDANTLMGTTTQAAQPDKVSGTNLRYLTTGMDPAISPDGQWVAFTRWDDVQHGAFGSLWIINVDGSDERMVLGEIRQPKSPVWSPDGTQIVMSMQHGGRISQEYKCSSEPPPREAYDVKIIREDDGDIRFCYILPPHPFWGLRMVNVNTGEFEDLPNDLFAYSPTWDPANPWRLVYDGEIGLLNLDLNQGTAWPLTNDVNDHSPVFSPDGSKLAVSYWQHDHWEIHVLNAALPADPRVTDPGQANGNGRTRLTKTPVRVTLEQQIKGETPRSWNNAAPTWSPDGSQIAFLTDRAGQWEIWVMNADGSNQRPLVSASALGSITLQYNGVDERTLSWQ